MSDVRIDGVKCLANTLRASLVLVPREGEAPLKVWIPMSQISEDSEVWKEGDEGTLVLPDWLADEKGIDHE